MTPPAMAPALDLEPEPPEGVDEGVFVDVPFVFVLLAVGRTPRLKSASRRGSLYPPAGLMVAPPWALWTRQ